MEPCNPEERLVLFPFKHQMNYYDTITAELVIKFPNHIKNKSLEINNKKNSNLYELYLRFQKRNWQINEEDEHLKQLVNNHN